MRETDQNSFAAAHAAGATVIDVREPYEYQAGHVPGARLVPLARIAEVRPHLPKDRPVYVICASGNRSLAAADFLARDGIDAYSVAGGTGAWARAGRPIDTGQRSGA
jgi:rhodanese-related sulfurtransferase